jgi:hypothetical protein
MKKKRDVFDRSYLPRLRWHRVTEGQAANATGPQNLSREMRGMPRQRQNKEANFVIY